MTTLCNTRSSAQRHLALLGTRSLDSVSVCGHSCSPLTPIPGCDLQRWGAEKQDEDANERRQLLSARGNDQLACRDCGARSPVIIFLPAGCSYCRFCAEGLSDWCQSAVAGVTGHAGPLSNPPRTRPIHFHALVAPGDVEGDRAWHRRGPHWLVLCWWSQWPIRVLLLACQSDKTGLCQIREGRGYVFKRTGDQITGARTRESTGANMDAKVE
ncbi:hypothetical protein DPEC_G00355610 [Dallia pectoralis]|uniref:Uncharacterized protein n=1 Tax=Dallia pectoralis TaxID=75939 RepID=A0ACC2EZM3_DALPE|nr:hypothetical protein DPEC_G00355610 [Dallia pectoralis]